MYISQLNLNLKMMMEGGEENLLQQPQYEEASSMKKIPLIYSWGRNQDGELAISNTKNTNIPTAPKGLKGYARQIATARTHTAVINSDGMIYLAGSLLFGKIGIKSDMNNFRQFRKMELSEKMPQKVRKVACGDYHTLALGVSGTLYSWGGTLWDKTGHKGSAGLNYKIDRLFGQKIIDIACGDFHSVAINQDGDIYSWGGGKQNKNKGQLGHSNKNDLPHPEQIQFFKGKRIVKIACGDYHTMIMTNDEELYAFGQGIFGQLGTGSKEDTATPKKVILNYSLALEDYFRSNISQKTRIQQMALGGHHSLLLTNKGHLYVCGYGAQGQLGLGQGNTQNKFQPCVVKSLMGKHIVMVAAGANHSLALTSKHDVYSCGYNAKGQLGIGEQKSITVWTHVTHLSQKNVGRIYAGGDHSWAVIDELQPFIQNYEPPSPIKLSVDELTITMNKGDISKKDDKSIASMDSLILEMNSNKKLELILTQVELSHRFIHFVANDNVRNYKKRIDDYIKAVYQIEKENMKYHKVTQDNQIYDEKGHMTLPSNPKGSTIMLVCQIPATATEYEGAFTNRNKISIGQILMLDANNLKVDGRIPNHNKWFFKFSQIMGECIEKVRFVELRPKRI